MFQKDASSTGAYRAYKISNGSVFLMNDRMTTKIYPNTNSIAHNYERPTQITIEVLSEPMYDMAVMITLVDKDGNMVTESNTSTGDNQGSNGSQEGNSGQGQGALLVPSITSDVLVIIFVVIVEVVILVIASRVVVVVVKCFSKS
jgi:hypothetical protein